MNEMPAKLKARADRKSAKRDEKKRQIAESAIGALKELGYANILWPKEILEVTFRKCRLPSP